MATAKKAALSSKNTSRTKNNQAGKKQVSSKKKLANTTKKEAQVARASNTVQLLAKATPLLAVVAAVFTYLSFSLAIDSGSYWHYIAGFYFVYQTVRLTKLTIIMMFDDKKRTTRKA